MNKRQLKHAIIQAFKANIVRVGEGLDPDGHDAVQLTYSQIMELSQTDPALVRTLERAAQDPQICGYQIDFENLKISDVFAFFFFVHLRHPANKRDIQSFQRDLRRMWKELGIQVEVSRPKSKFPHWKRVAIPSAILCVVFLALSCVQFFMIHNLKEELHEAENTIYVKELSAQSNSRTIQSLRGQLSASERDLTEALMKLVPLEDKSYAFDQVMVCTTPSGSKYHRFECQYIQELWKAGKTVTFHLRNSIPAKGYTPCSVCQPDKD